MADRKPVLSPSQQELLTEMQRINYGRIEGLSVRRGEPKCHGWLRYSV
jgi:hypothetical protein